MQLRTFGRPAYGPRARHEFVCAIDCKGIAAHLHPAVYRVDPALVVPYKPALTPPDAAAASPARRSVGEPRTPPANEATRWGVARRAPKRLEDAAVRQGGDAPGSHSGGRGRGSAAAPNRARRRAGLRGQPGRPDVPARGKWCPVHRRHACQHQRAACELLRLVAR